jgi:hypothetical protein
VARCHAPPIWTQRNLALASHTGLPSQLQRKAGEAHAVGVDFDVFDGAEAVRDVIGDGTPTAAERLASFRWGGTFVRYGAVVVIASLAISTAYLWLRYL